VLRLHRDGRALRDARSRTANALADADADTGGTLKHVGRVDVLFLEEATAPAHTGAVFITPTARRSHR
jgi:hypothetical protein